MPLDLTPRELQLVLDWRSGGAFFPDEDRVLRKLRQALRLDPAAREHWLDIVEEDIRAQLETPQLTLL